MDIYLPIFVVVVEIFMQHPNRNKQKKEELDMAKEFIHRQGWRYMVDGNTKEPAPDIFLTKNGDKIGLELTRSGKMNGEAEMKAVRF